MDIPNKMTAINNKMDGRIINHEMILEISISYRILDDFDNLRMRMDPHILFIARFCIEFCFLIAWIIAEDSSMESMFLLLEKFKF